MHNNIFPTQFPLGIMNSTVNETNLVLQLLSFMGAHLDKLSFQNEPLTHENLHEELLSMGDDGDTQQGFYIYWERNSNLIDIISIDDWESSDAEDQDSYEYHTFIIKSGPETQEIILAIN